jgi:hypothetical protein
MTPTQLHTDPERRLSDTAAQPIPLIEVQTALTPTAATDSSGSNGARLAGAWSAAGLGSRGAFVDTVCHLSVTHSTGNWL